MKVPKVFILAFIAASLITALHLVTRTANSQSEAAAGFDNQTNGFTTQAQFDLDRAAFEAREEIADGLGPVYNAQACGECHQNPVSGGLTQIFELRAGHIGPEGTFVNPPGGSLLQARAINAEIQERVPDGERIAFQAGSLKVSVMGFDGGQYGEIGNTPVNGTYPTWSPDGAQVAFASVNPSNDLSNIFVMNNDGTGLTQLTTSNFDTQPAWSRDGSMIAFASHRENGLWQIFTMNADGTNQTNISNSPANDTEPSWSPSGDLIAFSRLPQAIVPRSDIWTMKNSGGGQTQITVTFSANETRPAWSPDGNQIAFDTDRDGNWEIYIMDETGGAQTRLTNDPAVDMHPAWSPDAKTIAFGSARVTSGGGVGMHIWGMEPDGTKQARLSGPNGDLPAYSNDPGETVRTFRASLNVLGDGFVEATDDSMFIAIRDAQPPSMRGTAIFNAGLESPGEPRFSRFSWKGSVPTLLSFSAGAYQLESGITSPLVPEENTSLGRNVKQFDTVADPEDTGGPMGFGEDVEAFTRFMRSTKAPPRDRVLVPNDAVDAGSALFDQLSCNVCHTRSITTTANPATTFNNGTFTVGALANKTYHPFGDFLLHDIGTGDGIVETNGEVTRNKVRTAPLWGMRTRDRLMHDGGSSSPPTNSGAQSFTMNEVILRHAGQATASRNAFLALTSMERAQLFRFLKSL